MSMEARLSPGSFYGEIRKTHETTGLRFVESVYGPGYRIPQHSHERAYFCIVIAGGYTETYGRGSRECQPLTLVFHPEGEAHSDLFHEAGGRILSVEVAPGWLDRVRELTPVMQRPNDLQGGMPAWLGIRLHSEFREIDR